MVSLDEIRAHFVNLKRRRVTIVGHRAMLARLLDEVDALTAALAEKSAALADAERRAETGEFAVKVLHDMCGEIKRLIGYEGPADGDALVDAVRDVVAARQRAEAERDEAFARNRRSACSL